MQDCIHLPCIFFLKDKSSNVTLLKFHDKKQNFNFEKVLYFPWHQRGLNHRFHVMFHRLEAEHYNHFATVADLWIQCNILLLIQLTVLHFAFANTKNIKFCQADLR